MKIFIPTALWGTSPLKKGGVKELISNKTSDSSGMNATSSKLRGGIKGITLLYINKVGASHDAPTRNP